MRFVQLLKLCDFGAAFSLNDVGCGYGALLKFLRRAHGDCAVDYLGLDVSDEMVRLAEASCAGDPQAAAVHSGRWPRQADYSVASGTFNVCLDAPRDAWEAMIADTLAAMARTSRRGFAVNLLLPLHDRAGLYTTDPARWADHCAQTLGATPEVIGGYGMGEFTLLARF